MPIYAYRCSTCGFERDIMQKMADAPLTACPECHADTFVKQLTAAGFKLKGSGWYATDFKGGKKPDAPKPDAPAPCQGGVSDACATCPAAET
jgi:putative FmdB family regulatory protein